MSVTVDPELSAYRDRIGDTRPWVKPARSAMGTSIAGSVRSSEYTRSLCARTDTGPYGATDRLILLVVTGPVTSKMVAVRPAGRLSEKMIVRVSRCG